jgi:glycosyltransferase involved in cell wall biosynthesis
VGGSERGIVCDPTPEALAGALRQVMDDPRYAERIGAEALAWVRGLTWAETARTLLED